ncbi:MAG: HAD family hydrolase [Halobaculum sp.]
MYDAVLLDNDGVIVGRTRYEVLQEAAFDAFESVGVDPDPDDAERIAVAVSPAELRGVADRYGVEPAALIEARDRAAHERQRREVRAGRKDIYEDIAVLRDVDASLGIVSSNQQATVDFVVEHFGIGDLFGTAIGREPTPDSLRKKKPDSHYIDRALAALDADTALFVGDNESDVEAAHNAGIDSAFIRRPHRRDFDLDVTPTYDVSDLHELVAICRG